MLSASIFLSPIMVVQQLGLQGQTSLWPWQELGVKYIKTLLLKFVQIGFCNEGWVESRKGSLHFVVCERELNQCTGS